MYQKVKSLTSFYYLLALPMLSLVIGLCRKASRVSIYGFILFFILHSIISINLNAQTSNDSVRTMSQDAVQDTVEPDAAIYKGYKISVDHSASALEQLRAKVLLGDTLAIDHCVIISRKFIRDGNIDSLSFLIDILSGHFEGDTPYIGRLHNYYVLKSDYYSLEADFVEELNYLFKARDLLEPSQVKELLMMSQRIAVVYYRLYDYKSCLDVYEQSVDLVKRLDSDYGLLYSYYGIADCYYALDSFSLAKKVCNQALDLSERSGITGSIGFIYSLMSNIYLAESKLDSARYYGEKGVEMSSQQNELKELYDNYNSMVNVELASGNVKKAQYFAELAIDNPMYHLPELYNNLAKLYTDQGRHQDANILLQKNIDNYVSLTNKNSVYSVVSTLLKSKYKQENKIFIAQQDRKYQKTKLYLILLVSLILFTSALFVLNSQVKTRRKVQKMNQDLIEQNKSLEQFAFICSHDLIEPIRNIGSYSSLIQQKLQNENLSSNYDEYFQVINTGTSVLRKLVSSLKIYTEVSQENVLAKSELSIQEQVDTVLISISDLVAESGVDLNFTNHIGNQKFMCSEYGLQVILTNLITNAIKHNSKDDKRVDIVATRSDDDILLTIKDNGEGISQDFFEHIFLPFKTLANKSTIDSSGLGLAICHRIINILGGKIWLTSELGQGSQFYVLIHQ